jgi:hypothetical protein
VRNPFKRGTHVPAPVVRAARLRSGERVLAATAANDGTWLLGTRDAFVVVRGNQEEPLRLPWEDVERADWDGDAERFRILEVGRFGEPRPEHGFLLDDPGLLVQMVRERVTASVVMQRRVTLGGRQGFFVIARRPPSGSGEITWAFEFDRGVDPDDPDVQRATEQALRMAAEELGLG